MFVNDCKHGLHHKNWQLLHLSLISYLVDNNMLVMLFHQFCGRCMLEIASSLSVKQNDNFLNLLPPLSNGSKYWGKRSKL